MNKQTKQEIINEYNSNKMSKAGKARWAKATPEERTAHANKMVKARRDKKKQAE